MVAALVFGFRVAAAQPTLRDRRTAVLALCAIAWAFLHGMGDNTGLYGDRQSMILVAVAFGYLYAMSRDRKQVSLGFTSDETQDPTAISAKAPGDQQSGLHRGHPRVWADELAAPVSHRGVRGRAALNPKGVLGEQHRGGRSPKAPTIGH
jgi:hypothetical protein